MVFGFFSRKSHLQEDSANADSNPSASITGSVPPQSPSPPPEDEVTQAHVVPTDLPSLYKLVKSVPPKVLHDYTVARLRSEDDVQFAPVLSFFSDLKPPERLHCVRCHRNYFEVDNTDRSCQIDHDDESAVVERVGGEYETLYGCCDRTVKGEGDMGPPDGWCYEGEHTTDPIRARFRADSTPRDTMLPPCTKRCGPISGAGAAATTRKRRRAQSDSEDTEDEGEEDSGVEEMAGNKGITKPASPKKRAPKKTKVVQDEADNAEAPPTPKVTASNVDSPAPKQRKRAPKKSVTLRGEEEEKMDTSPAETMAPKSRKRAAKKSITAQEDKAEDKTDTNPTDSPAPKPRKRAPRKSAAIVDEETNKDADPAESPAPKPRKRPTKKSEVTMEEADDLNMDANPAERPKPKKVDDMDVDTDVGGSPKPKSIRTPVKRGKGRAKEDPESGPSPKASVKSAMKGKPVAKPRSTGNKAKSLKEVVTTSVEGEDV